MSPVTIFEAIELIERIAAIVRRKMAEGKMSFNAREIGEANAARLDELREANQNLPSGGEGTD